MEAISLPAPAGGELDSRVQVAKAFIETNKNRIIYGDDVAKECCLSLKHLNRLFRTEIGSSVFEYITAVRIRYAKKLLFRGERSIKEISYLMGFESESGFVSFFKRHCHMPPGVFRKQYAETEEKCLESETDCPVSVL